MSDVHPRNAWISIEVILKIGSIEVSDTVGTHVSSCTKFVKFIVAKLRMSYTILGRPNALQVHDCRSLWLSSHLDHHSYWTQSIVCLKQYKFMSYVLPYHNTQITSQTKKSHDTTAGRGIRPRVVYFGGNELISLSIFSHLQRNLTFQN
jgi:hypothetical protein